MKTTDGLELTVCPRGPDDAAVTVVLAHCWTADMDDWQYQVRDLLDAFGHDVRIVTWDHRGHGSSDAAPLGDCTIEHLARDMADVIDAHAGTGRLVIAGHSIGGMAMMALAEQRPDILARIAGVLFVVDLVRASSTRSRWGCPRPAGGSGPRSPGCWRCGHGCSPARFAGANPRIESEVVHRFLFGQPMRLRDCGLVVDQLINCPPATMEGFYRDFMTHDRAAALAAFDGIPTRVLVGDRDVLTPVAHARRIAAGIAHRPPGDRSGSRAHAAARAGPAGLRRADRAGRPPRSPPTGNGRRSPPRREVRAQACGDPPSTTPSTTRTS